MLISTVVACKSNVALQNDKWASASDISPETEQFA